MKEKAGTILNGGSEYHSILPIVMTLNAPQNMEIATDVAAAEGARTYRHNVHVCIGTNGVMVIETVNKLARYRPSLSHRRDSGTTKQQAPDRVQTVVPTTASTAPGGAEGRE